MDEDPLQPIAPETLKIIQPVAAPIWFDDGERVLNGTCTLLNLGDRRFGVTCDHVLRSCESDPIIAGFRVSRDRIVDQCPKLDLAVIDLEAVGDRIESLEKCRFHEPACWPPPAVTEDDMVAYCGLPGEWREELTFAQMGHANAHVKLVEPTYLVTSIDLPKCNVFQDAGDSWDDLRGMSGGPVFMWHNVRYELVGVIYEDARSFDLIYVRLLHVIGEDGNLRRRGL